MMISSAADYQSRLGLDFTPSSYQVGLFEFISNGRGNGMGIAVAGAGKSTSLGVAVRIARQSSRFVLALAFNREARAELETKLDGSGARVKTVHSHGLDAVKYALGYRNVEVDYDKYRKRVDGYIDEFESAKTLAGDDCSPDEVKSIIDNGYPRAAIIKLLDLARLDLLDSSSPAFGQCIRAIADHHNIDVDPVLCALVIDVVRLCMEWGSDTPTIVDGTDMVWLPTVLRLRPWTADWVFVDEAQDISKAHRALIRRSMKRDGRALFVGDEKQAIYGFAGADADSFRAIVDEFNCTLLPLSVCYRCPTSVLDLARVLCPQIEARPGAPAGIVRNSSTDAFIAGAKRDDMVLCRLNGPLMGIAFRLIAAGVSATVRGRADLGEGLARIIDGCAKAKRRRDRSSDYFYGDKPQPWRDVFSSYLDAWEDSEKEKARKRHGKRADALAAKIEAIADQAECIRVIWGASDATTAGELKSAIAKLFADKDPKVVLSSVHRAKGLEADRVFIARPERLGKAWPDSQPWMIEQEKNLEYVAITRAKMELVFLVDDAPESPAPKPTRDDETDAVESIPPTPVPAAQQQPAPLPSVDADAPDTYHPNIRPSRVALARMLDAALRGQGFTAASARGTRETVYTLTVAPGHDCLVYSTIVDGACRGLGEDSIKVCLVDSSGAKTRGIGKARRVNRVGLLAAIVGRVQSRVDGLRK